MSQNEWSLELIDKEEEARARYIRATGDNEPINNRNEFAWGLPSEIMPKGAVTPRERAEIYDDCARLGITWAEHLGVGDRVKLPLGIIL